MRKKRIQICSGLDSHSTDIHKFRSLKYFCEQALPTYLHLGATAFHDCHMAHARQDILLPPAQLQATELRAHVFFNRVCDLLPRISINTLERIIQNK